MEDDILKEENKRRQAKSIGTSMAILLALVVITSVVSINSMGINITEDKKIFNLPENKRDGGPSTYTVTELEGLHGYYYGCKRINDNGEVLGWSAADPGPSTYINFVMWLDNGTTVLDLGQYDFLSTPGEMAINDYGRVVVKDYEDRYPQPIYRPLKTGIYALDEDLGEVLSYGYVGEVNNNNEICGTYDDGVDYYGLHLVDSNEDGIWEEINLGQIADFIEICEANSINDLGQIVGNYQDIYSDVHPCIWEPDGFGSYEIINLSTSSTADYAYDINDFGQVVGKMQNGEIVYWDEYGVRQDLNMPGTTWYNTPVRINNQGIVAATNTEPEGYMPCIWKDGTWYHLQDLVDTQDFELEFCRDINDYGQILVSAREGGANCQRILTPLSNDVGVTTINSPAASSELFRNRDYLVNATISNFGSTQTSAIANCTIRNEFNELVYSQEIIMEMDPYTTEDIEFIPPWHTNQPGVYTVTVTCLSDGDENPSNDQQTIQVTVILQGDLNHDGDVDMSDLAELLGNYGTTSGATYEDGDIDGDGDVDLHDLAELLGNYGYGT